MKTVILCGGRGIRLNEETEFKPKPLVEIGGMPILWHIMKHYSHYGHNEFILPLGYKGEAIKEYFLKLKENSQDFVLNLANNEKEFLDEQKSLEGKIYFINTGLNSMTGSRVSQIKKYIEEEDFFLTYGDGVSDVNINNLYEHYKKSKAILTLTGSVPSSQFGIIESDNGIVTTFKEKPIVDCDNINGGFMVCNKKIFDYLSNNENCILEKEPMARLVNDKKLGVYSHKGFWHCMDTQRDVNELNKLWHEGAPWKIWD